MFKICAYRTYETTLYLSLKSKKFAEEKGVPILRDDKV